jgi:hypothetical protein
MSDLRDLYQQVILDHNRKPRTFRKIADANRTAKGYNPLCGDPDHPVPHEGRPMSFTGDVSR